MSEGETAYMKEPCWMPLFKLVKEATHAVVPIFLTLSQDPSNLIMIVGCPCVCCPILATTNLRGGMVPKGNERS